MSEYFVIGDTRFVLAPEQEPSIPPEWELLWGLHDYQLRPSVWTDEDKNRDNRPRTWPQQKSVPETITRYEKASFIPVKPAWAWYWFRNLIYCGFGHFDEAKLIKAELDAVKASWISLIKGTRVITNDHGWDQGYWDPITNLNSGNEPFRIDQLFMGGNWCRKLGEPVRKAGQMFYPFETLDMSKAPPDIHEVNMVTRPDLFPRATIITYHQLADGTFRVDPFPQMEWKNGHSVLMSVSLGGIGHIPVNRVAALSGSIPNPYNPPRSLAWS